MLKTGLIRAWLMLMVLSSISTFVAVFIDRGHVASTTATAGAGAVILLLSLIKGRIILSRYLGLEKTRFWRRGFNFALGSFSVLLLGLYLAPML
jgi:nitric oxide reductase NorF protein